MEKKGLKLKTGVIVDASITESPPKGKPVEQIAEDRPKADKEKEKKEQSRLKRINNPGVDGQARWLKKGLKTTFGYKKHMAVDGNGMVLGVHSTTANEHDSKGLESTLKKVPQSYCRAVYTDKGYQNLIMRKC